MDPDFVERVAAQFYYDHRQLVDEGYRYADLRETETDELRIAELNAEIGRVAVEKDVNLKRAEYHKDMFLHVYIADAQYHMEADLEARSRQKAA